MSFLRERLPSREQVYLLFLAILFPVNFWALIGFLRELPAYMLRFSSWEIVGVLSYILVVALIDSLLLAFVVLLITQFAPGQLRKEHFTSLTALTAYLVILWVVPIHYQEAIGARLTIVLESWFKWLWLASLAAGVAGVWFLLANSSVIEKTTLAFLDRLSVLSTVYFFVNLAGLAIVIVRNLVSVSV